MNVYSSKQVESDQHLWSAVIRGDKSAFEQLVTRHQASVLAVAFAVCGDFASSQDIAQETFWAAWNSRDKLRDAKRLGRWLRGISRNLARNWRRSNLRKSKTERIDGTFHEPKSPTIDPTDQIIFEEESAAIWTSLDKLPDNYRKVLRLYYDDGHSIEEVALKLGINSATARQRLFRGREMLRSHVSQKISGVLDRKDPSRTFTARVMAGITGTGVTAAAANASAATPIGTVAASSAVVAAKVLTPGLIGAIGGILGGLVGALGGLLGGFIGAWLPAELAPTETERRLLHERAKPLIAVSILFTIVILALSLSPLFNVSWKIFVGGFLISIFSFQGYVLANVLKTVSLLKRLRKEISPEEDPNQSKLAKKYGWGARQAIHKTVLKGRSYDSSMKLLGLPLISIQTSDIVYNYDMKSTRKTARGWIAIGDVAQGLIFALGQVAIGPIAFGGVAVGFIAIGCLAIGGLALGCGAVGFISAGGIGIGYDTIGGFALGWHSAVGGGAIAYEMAYGGGAIAHDFAVGGGAHAIEANTELAKKMIDEHSLKRVSQIPREFKVAAFGIVFATLLAYHKLCYRRVKDDGNEDND